MFKKDYWRTKALTVKIGQVEIKNNIFLAPMAGVSDMTFRGICALFGCGLTYTEMVSAKGLSYNNKNTAALLEIHPNEQTKAIQIFGSDEFVMAETAEKLSEYPVDIIDINMGCPAKKIVGNGDGSALMKDPEKIGRIVEKVSRATSKPVTVKIRKGVDESSTNAVEVARIAEANGAAAVCVHGRFASQYYSGTADWDIIREVKQVLKIPVIGNGDVVSVESYQAMLDYTGCDAVMIGRAAQGNPWIFSQIVHYIKTGEKKDGPTYDEKIDMALFHGRQLIRNKGEYIGMREMRKHLGWYVKGMDGASELRKTINTLATYDEMVHMFKQYMDFVNTGKN